MADRAMLTDIDKAALAEAFPPEHRLAAVSAGEAVSRALAPPQWTERFSVRVAGQCVLIPARLRFDSERLRLNEHDEAWRFARALQTRSNDGFERQRAARDLMIDLEPWGAPFIVTLIGEDIVEILDDVFDAMTPDLERTLGAFIAENKAYWATTKRRVASYWNAYYRSSWASELRAGISTGRVCRLPTGRTA